MSDEKSVRFVPTTLYTTEASESRKKAEEDLKISDPTPERAEALLNFDEDTEESE